MPTIQVYQEGICSKRTRGDCWSAHHE